MAAESRGHVWGAAQVAYGAFGYLFPIARGPGRRYRKPNAVRSERNLRMVCGRAASSEKDSLTIEGRDIGRSGGDAGGELHGVELAQQGLALGFVHDHAGCGLKFAEQVVGLIGHSVRDRALVLEGDHLQCHLGIVEHHHRSRLGGFALLHALQVHVPLDARSSLCS